MPDESSNEEEIDPFDDLDEEFSLDKLSKAYAEVIRQRSPDADPAVSEESYPGNPDAESGQRESENPGHETVIKSGKAKLVGGGSADDGLEGSTLPNEADDNQGCPIEPDTIIESIVFVGAPQGTALTLAGIAAVLRDVNTADVRQAAKNLNATYEQDRSAWRIMVDGDGDDAEIKMVLEESLAPFQNHYFGRNKEVQLAQGTIDVLAVVAYHQPVSKSEVENTRGKPCGAVLSQLVRRDLLAIETTDEKPVKKLYRTTKRFLELFQLSDVGDLPQSHDVSEFEEYID